MSSVIAFVMRSKLAIGALIIGLGVREALAPFTGHPYDFELWVRLGYYVSRGADPYVWHPAVPGLSFPASGDPRWPGYPPVWPLLLAAIYKAYAFSGIQNRFFYYFLIKQPMVLADVADAFIISKLVSVYSSPKNALRSFAFWLLCPYTIIISSVWGMFDQLILLLALIALYYVAYTGRSALTLAFGTALKLIPVIFLPLFAGIQKPKKAILLYVTAALSTTAALAYTPYLLFGWNVSALNSVELTDASRVANSLNYWEVVSIYYGTHPLHTTAFDILWFLAYLWIPCVIAASIFCVFRIRGKPELTKNLMLSGLVVTLVFLLTKSAVSEQFVIYFLGFGAFDYFVISSKERRALFHAVWVSSLAYLILASQFMASFLSPLSSYYFALDFFPGSLVYMWHMMLEVLALAFTVLCTAYSVSLFAEIDLLKESRQRLSENALPSQQFRSHEQ